MMGEWTMEDQLKALNQGWGIFDSSDHGVRIERIDMLEIFKSDLEAIAFVNAKAVTGNVLARKAVAYVKRWRKVNDQ